MKQLLNMRGIITVLNTPFLDDDTLDCEGLRSNVHYAIDAGVGGFLVPAMASEVGKLTRAERLSLVETVIDAAAGRVPVIGGASAPTQSERLDAARAMIQLGCSGVLASIPFESKEAYRRDVESLAGLQPGFLMIQDWDFTGDGLPMDVIVQLFEEIPAFRCLKIETAQAGAKYTRVLEATGGKLHVSGGWAVTQMIEGLDRGIHAFMPTGLHRSYAYIYAAYAAGKRDEAVTHFHRLAPILAFSNQHLDLSIHFFKKLLHAQGHYTTARVREPILPLDRYQARYADELIQLAVDIESRHYST
ncbi:MAG TPA: dihydrodipicolinate synthase family protein [Candidatus Hydrogenedentes bacterium]|nr:dihydrodipicolinate synthase family protein [Candidatus Hydrogenedentota bacterium]